MRCFPLDEADDAMEAAVAAAAAMGGAGFDALLARAQRVWQVEAAEDGWEACTVMAVLSNVWLAPVLPPEAERLFGTKGARERLARHA